MIILSIETSCDETSISILKDKNVLSNVTFSQILKQKKFNGVMPSLASKLHVKNIRRIFSTALKKSKISIEEIDFISYTNEPGMVICLQIGKIVAETISLYIEKPIIPCNHLFGHIYSTLLENKKEWKFPSLAFVISGGHTQLYLLKDHLNIENLGKTLDDAAGEFLDKSAIILGYEYPGGPIIEKLAKLNKKKNIKLPFPKNDSSLDFSFSGLKSEVLRLCKKRLNNEIFFDDYELAHSIQIIIGKIIVKKIVNVFKLIGNIKTIIFGGGVTANKFLKKYIIEEFKKIIIKNKKNDKFDIDFFFPKKKYSTDNAAMIGILTYYYLNNNNKLL